MTKNKYVVNFSFDLDKAPMNVPLLLKEEGKLTGNKNTVMYVGYCLPSPYHEGKVEFKSAGMDSNEVIIPFAWAQIKTD